MFGVDPLWMENNRVSRAQPRAALFRNTSTNRSAQRLLQISLSSLNLEAGYTVLHMLRSEEGDSWESKEELRRIKRGGQKKNTRKVGLGIIQIKINLVKRDTTRDIRVVFLEVQHRSLSTA